MAAHIVGVLRRTARRRFVVSVIRLPVRSNRKLTGLRGFRAAPAQFPAGRHHPVAAHVLRRAVSVSAFTGSSFGLPVCFNVADWRVRGGAGVEVVWLGGKRRCRGGGGVSSGRKRVVGHRAARHLGKPEVGVDRGGWSSRTQAVEAITSDRQATNNEHLLVNNGVNEECTVVFTILKICS